MITVDVLLEARWRNVRRLARALGVVVPAWCSRRRRSVIARRIMEAIYPPTDYGALVRAWTAARR